MNIQIYELDYEAYMQYKNDFNNKKEVDFDTAQKCLSRNIALAKFMKHDEETDRQYYGYGRMVIVTTHDAIITEVLNYKKQTINWVLDEVKKAKINKRLGLVD